MKTLKLSRFVVAACAAGFIGSTFAADDTAAIIQDLKQRIEKLEAQLKSQQAAPAPAAPAAAPTPVAAAPAAPAAPAGGDFKLTWGGYVKFDALASRFSDGAVAQGTGRDFFVPNSVPVAAPNAANARSYVDFQAKETRLFLAGNGKLWGHNVSSRVEVDFISGQTSQAIAGAGTETITNAYNPALRLAYVTFDHITVGQDWSTFQNLVAISEALDFTGYPAVGTVFIRQPVIRYTDGGFQISLENPQSTVAARGGAAFTNTDDNVIPDLVAKYTFKSHFGEFSIAGLARQVTDRGTIGTGNDSSFGFGISLAGKIPLWGKDDLRFTFNGGDGIGRYVAFNSVGEAVVDAAGKLKTVEIISGYLAYRHVWNDQWRTNIAVGAYHANTGQIGLGTNFGANVDRRLESASINLLYSPIKPLTFGAEYRYGRRDTVGNNSGDLQRLQFSAKYSF